MSYETYDTNQNDCSIDLNLEEIINDVTEIDLDEFTDLKPTSQKYVCCMYHSWDDGSWTEPYGTSQNYFAWYEKLIAHLEEKFPDYTIFHNFENFKNRREETLTFIKDKNTSNNTSLDEDLFCNAIHEFSKENFPSNDESCRNIWNKLHWGLVLDNGENNCNDNECENEHDNEYSNHEDSNFENNQEELIRTLLSGMMFPHMR